MFKRAGKDRTREAIRWRVQQYGPVKQFEEHGISFQDLSPAFEREIAAQTRRILLGPGPAAASETGAAIVRPKMLEASLIKAANSARTTRAKKRAASHDIETRARKRHPKTPAGRERGTKTSPWKIVEEEERVGGTTSEEVHADDRSMVQDALVTRSSARSAGGSPSNAKIPESMPVDAVVGRGAITPSSESPNAADAPRSPGRVAAAKTASDSINPTHTPIIVYLEKKLENARLQLQLGQAVNNTLRKENEELRRRIGKLTTPSNAALRQAASDLELERATLVSEKLTINSRHQDAIRCLEELLEAKAKHIGHLQTLLSTLRGPQLVSRSQGYPIEYDAGSLNADWRQNVARLASDCRPYDMARSLRAEEQVPVKLEAAMRAVTGLSVAQTGNLTLAECFTKTTAMPTDVNIRVACFMSHVLRWCFNTAFHTRGLKSEKLHEMWQSIALLNGLKCVRQLDTMATLDKISNKYFREHQLPEKAKNQMGIFIRECRSFIPWLDSAKLRPKLDEWLQSTMEMKLELLVSSQHHKLAFPPPGAPYDKSTMEGQTEDGNRQGPKDNPADYRVKICVCPALYTCIPEPDLLDIADPSFKAEKYKDALLEDRDFFSEEPGKYHGWEGAVLVSRAIVFVEKYPQQSQVVPEQSQPRQTLRLRLTPSVAEDTQDVAEGGEDGMSSQDDVKL
ncbi:hypothetical protein J4E83_010599 [Alternaria metachromatica]|uniref:uncharacterized protein n=1 Tax=Alternaria metachromatica TaxID=283354 RepID=UPI0020C5937C|nr:uncharacterized protein J4E83_010599 [Alternaria metachromatica]KAI4605401.1 hypothetical protein J4E83_010599 [Alternaria metachromatica]